MPKFLPLNCHICGRFVGADGDPDTLSVFMGEPAEIGYPRCGRCVRKDEGGEEVAERCATALDTGAMSSAE